MKIFVNDFFHVNHLIGSLSVESDLGFLNYGLLPDYYVIDNDSWQIMLCIFVYVDFLCLVYVEQMVEEINI